jgi:hypothetical protein
MLVAVFVEGRTFEEMVVPDPDIFGSQNQYIDTVCNHLASKEMKAQKSD